MTTDKQITAAWIAQVFIASTLAVTGWLLAQVYSNIVSSIAAMEQRFEEHARVSLYAVEKADERLAQNMLLITQRLEDLDDRVEELERGQ